MRLRLILFTLLLFLIGGLYTSLHSQGQSRLHLPLLLHPDPAQPLTLRLLSAPADGVEPYAHFTFSASQPASLECALDGAPFAPCESPLTILDLAVGAHRFALRARDSAAALSHTWQVQSVFEAPPPTLVHHGVTPEPDPDGGSFRIKCEFSHANYDDPIVFPGEPGRAHLHLYLGNMLADASSTINSMVTTGDSSCNGGWLNRSAYWVPALLAPLADGSYHFVLPTDGPFSPDIYYKSAVDNLAAIQPMPHGLRMIAGDGSATGPQERRVVRWSCESWPIRSGDDFATHIPRCAVGDQVALTVTFPSCWDGQALYRADQSHMAYPEAFPTTGGGYEHRCPESHPVTLPVVSYNFFYPVTSENAPQGDSRGWRLSSDRYEVSEAMPGGYSAHGDWFMAWHPEIMQALVVHCLHAGRHCAGGDLGNGWRLGGLTPGPGTIPPIINHGRYGSGGTLQR